jgi:5-methylcytosine-specific restriction endonuclease McrA
MPVALPKPEKRAPKTRRRIARTKGGKGKRTSRRRATRTQLRNLCDELFSVSTRLLGGGECRHCGAGSGQSSQCAHLISRGKYSTRWERDNAWCLCPQCHTRYTHDPEGWQDLMMDTFGADAWHARIKSARSSVGAPLYDQIVPLLVDELEAAHRAVPYDALTEGLHERAREVLAKAVRLGFEVMR